MADSIYDFTVKKVDGGQQSLADYAGDVLLVVNTATKCGFTPQLEGLEGLQRKYAARGFSVLGFPCNQFGHQAPEASDKIDEFCKLTFGCEFPTFAKIDVNGEHADPLYVWLRSQQGGVLGDAIKWNFTKFLVGRDGQVIGRFAPTTTPEQLEEHIEEALR